jgi:hypothetical protein
VHPAHERGRRLALEIEALARPGEPPRGHVRCIREREEVSMDMQTTQTNEESMGGKGQLEGKTTKKIERATAAIPSGTFLVLAGGAVAGSLVLKLLGRHTTANFIGEWVPTILMLGLYNKIVKVLGSERGGSAASSALY